MFALSGLPGLQVMKSLMSDTAAVAKAARTHDARIEGLARAIQMQHEALSRSCAVREAALPSLTLSSLCFGRWATGVQHIARWGVLRPPRSPCPAGF